MQQNGLPLRWELQHQQGLGLKHYTKSSEVNEREVTD